MQEGVRVPPEGPGIHRQIWSWIDGAKKKMTRTECLEEEVDLAALDFLLDWKTYLQSESSDDPPEPIAGGEAAQPGSSSTGSQKPPPPTRQELRRRFDQLRMVGAQEATTMRQKRARRTQLVESGYRVFTTDLLQADSHRCHVDISP